MKKEQNLINVTPQNWQVTDENENFMLISAKTAQIAAKIFRDNYPSSHKLKIS